MFAADPVVTGPGIPAVYYVLIAIGSVAAALGGAVAAIMTARTRKDAKTISSDTRAINNAVNHAAPGDPTLLEFVKTINKKVDDNDARTQETFAAFREVLHRVESKIDHLHNRTNDDGR